MCTYIAHESEFVLMHTILMTTIQIKADMHAYKRIHARDTYKL